MFNSWKDFEAGIKNLSSGASNSKDIALARKYGVPENNGKFDAGCPGIMSPLGETPKIELQWGALFSGHNQDKVERFQQFLKALNLIDAYITESNAHNLINGLIELKVHGRVMFSHIVSSLPQEHEDRIGEIFNIVGPHLTTELDMTAIPYNKGGATVQQIFDKYIKPLADIYYFPVAAAAAEAEAQEPDTVVLEVNDNRDEATPSDAAASAASGSHGNTMGNAFDVDLTE